MNNPIDWVVDFKSKFNSDNSMKLVVNIVDVTFRSLLCDILMFKHINVHGAVNQLF